MKKSFALFAFCMLAAASSFAQGARSGRIHFGMGTEMEISKIAGGGAAATGGEAVVPIDFLFRFMGREGGDFSLGLAMRFGIGFPKSFNWYGPLPVLTYDEKYGYYEIAQTQTALWTFERDGAKLFKFNFFFGAACQKRIVSPLSLVFEAGFAVHHASASWNMLSDSGGSWVSGWIYYDGDDYDEVNATLQDTTMGLALNLGLRLELGLFYIEAGAGASYDFLHTTSGKIKLENAYREITYRRYDTKTDTVNLFVFSAPYISLGFSF